MPLRIDEMTTSLEIRDEERTRRMLREEIERVLRERERGDRPRRRSSTDPSAGSGMEE